MWKINWKQSSNLVGNELDSSTNFNQTWLVIVLNNEKIEAYRVDLRRKQFFSRKS